MTMNYSLYVVPPPPAVSEAMLWDACVRWAKQECGRQSLEATPLNQRKVMGENLGLIRCGFVPVDF